MKIKTLFIFTGTFLLFCSAKIQNEDRKQASLPIAGTWQLLSGTIIEKNDTVVTYYTKNLSFIKIINDTHFAFLEHDLKKGKDSSTVFVSGGGRYSLRDSLYIEHLEYCSDRNWEGNDFEFTIKIKNDTLIQSGIEKVDNGGVNRLNIEKFIRIKD